MKRTMILLGAVAALSLTGCATQNLAASLKALGEDPAIVVGKVTSVYGTFGIIRIGGTTNSVTVSPDGTVTVNK